MSQQEYNEQGSVNDTAWHVPRVDNNHSTAGPRDCSNKTAEFHTFISDGQSSSNGAVELDLQCRH